MNKSAILGAFVGAAVVVGATVLASRMSKTETSEPAPAKVTAVTGDVAATVDVAAHKDVAPIKLAAAPKKAAYAQVTGIKPVTKTIETPREVCHDEEVTTQAPVKDEHKIAGTAIGAVVGGILGNQVGGGDGKKIATVAGAAAGGYAGNRIQDRMQKGNTVTTTEKRCTTVTDTTEKTIGYNVTYKLDGRTETIRMDHRPGDRIPVRDGKLVLTQTKQLSKS